MSKDEKAKMVHSDGYTGKDLCKRYDGDHFAEFFITGCISLWIVGSNKVLKKIVVFLVQRVGVETNSD